MSVSDFTTRGDVIAFLQDANMLAEGIDQDSLDRAMIEADATIREWCNQHISYVEDDVAIFDGGASKLFLPELPIVEIASVVEDGETLVADTDYKLGRYGILHRLTKKWSSGIQNIAVTYSHGYETIPQIVRDIATRAASRAYQAGAKAADSAGVPGVASKSLGDFSVSYSSEPLGSGAGEGLMGASGARMLLMSEKDMLANYRVKNIS